jgi:hypothetical protein
MGKKATRRKLAIRDQAPIQGALGHWGLVPADSTGRPSRATRPEEFPDEFRARNRALALIRQPDWNGTPLFVVRPNGTFYRFFIQPMERRPQDRLLEEHHRAQAQTQGQASPGPGGHPVEPAVRV